MQNDSRSRVRYEPARPMMEGLDKTGWAPTLRALLRWLAQYLGLVIAALGSLVIWHEVAEHGAEVHTQPWHVAGEVGLALLLLGLMALLTKSVIDLLDERTQRIATLRLKHNLGLHLSSSRDLDEVVRRLIRQIAWITPAAEIDLYLYQRPQGWFIRAAEPGSAAETHAPASGIDPSPCRHCLTDTRTTLHPLESCHQGQRFQPAPGRAGYCLPLTQGTWPVGLLQLTLPARRPLTAPQVELLEATSPEMACSLQVASERQAMEAVTLTMKLRALQLEIARDLHDTLGQNITYLQLKLGQLQEAHVDRPAGAAQEFQHLYEVAHEAHDLVRSTLAVLHADQPYDLPQLVRRYAEQVAQRSELELDFTIQGQPQPLPSGQARHLFYILREALANIEKHASATHLRIAMAWGDASLTLTVADNGCGFEPAQVQADAHYGLRNLHQRAEQLHGALSIRSASGDGTTLVLRVPLSPTVSPG